MKNSTRKLGSNERLGNSLKIAAFVAVAGFVTLAVTSHLTLSTPESMGFGDDGYTTIVDDTPPSDTAAVASPDAAASKTAAKAIDYFPSQFEIKGAAAADPSVPTY